MLSNVQIIDFGDQARKDSIAWLETKVPGQRLSQERREAYEAGYANGWREAIATLKLHGYQFS